MSPSYRRSVQVPPAGFQKAWRRGVEDADQQLDYVFASRGFHKSIKTHALNSVEEWGSSDHCRILIDVSAD